jgi:RNA-directed DNA polymerase
MKKIDKELFFKILDTDQQIIPETLSEQVIQFKIGKRFVYAVKNDLKLVAYHEALNNKFLNHIPLNNAAKAFRKGGSYFEFLEPHRFNYNFLRLDLKNFFHSISEETMKDVFSNYFENQTIEVGATKQKLLDSFLSSVCFKLPDISENQSFAGKSIVPMGFKTSPVISNIIFRKLDIIIQRHCIEGGIEYTRYADDLLFSSSIGDNYLGSQTFINTIAKIVASDGFKLNSKKTTFKKHLMSINGYVIEGARGDLPSGDVRLSNSKLKVLEKFLFELKKNTPHDDILKKVFCIDVKRIRFPVANTKQDFLDKYCRDQLVNKIAGYRSYLISFLKFLAKSGIPDSGARARYVQTIGKLEKAITKIENG